jgi:hypothetical protein
VFELRSRLLEAYLTAATFPVTIRSLQWEAVDAYSKE